MLKHKLEPTVIACLAGRLDLLKVNCVSAEIARGALSQATQVASRLVFIYPRFNLFYIMLA